MNTLWKALITLATGSLITMSAQAAMTYGSYTTQPYVGIKVGQFDLDFDIDGADLDVDNPTAYGIYAGFYFDSSFGMEVEYVGSGDADISVAGFKGDIDAKNYGAYGTYRHAFPNTGLYAKGKLGFAKTEVEGNLTDGMSVMSLSISDKGIAGGLGLGYEINPDFNIEAEYVIMDSDVDAKLLTVGAHLKF